MASHAAAAASIHLALVTYLLEMVAKKRAIKHSFLAASYTA